MRDTFYKVHNLSFVRRRNILKKAKSLAYDWRVDFRSYETKYIRKKVEMSFEDIMKKFNKDCHFVIIARDRDIMTNEPYLEIAFCTLTEPEYYLWLYLDLSHLTYFINTYDLIPFI